MWHGLLFVRVLHFQNHMHSGTAYNMPVAHSCCALVHCYYCYCLSEAHGQNSHAGGRGSSSTDDDSGRPQITAPDGTTRTAPVPVAEREPPILVNNFQHTISEDVRACPFSLLLSSHMLSSFRVVCLHVLQHHSSDRASNRVVVLAANISLSHAMWLPQCTRYVLSQRNTYNLKSHCAGVAVAVRPAHRRHVPVLRGAARRQHRAARLPHSLAQEPLAR